MKVHVPCVWLELLSFAHYTFIVTRRGGNHPLQMPKLIAAPPIANRPNRQTWLRYEWISKIPLYHVILIFAAHIGIVLYEVIAGVPVQAPEQRCIQSGTLDPRLASKKFLLICMAEATLNLCWIRAHHVVDAVEIVPIPRCVNGLIAALVTDMIVVVVLAVAATIFAAPRRVIASKLTIIDVQAVVLAVLTRGGRNAMNVRLVNLAYIEAASLTATESTRLCRPCTHAAAYRRVAAVRY